MSGAAPVSLVPPDVIQAMVALARTTPPGAFVEVGVWQGGSAWHLAEAAEAQARKIYLYDTFRGIPWKDPRDSHQVGDFADTTVHGIRTLIPYAEVIQGIFPESAVPMGPVAFVHLDCDQYRSYLEALETLGWRMVKGGVIWCDDVPCLVGATAAVREFAEAHGIEVIPVTDVCHHKAFLQF